MKTRTGLLLALVFMVALSSCARPQPSVQTFDPLPPAAGGQIIQSQPGDTVYGIARRYNVSMRDVIALNNLRAPFILKPGTPLTLPAKEGEQAPAIIESPAPQVQAVEAPQTLDEPIDVGGKQTYRQDAPIRLGRADEVELPPVQPLKASSATPEKTPDDKRPVQTERERVIYAPVQQDELDRLVTQEAQKPEPRMPAAPLIKLEERKTEKQAVKDKPLAAGLTHNDVTRELNLSPLQFDEGKKELKPPKLNAGKAAPSTSGARFMWPVQGRIVSGFGPKDNGLRNDGINIAAPRSSPVVAAEGGTVAYAGNDIPGYGNVVLIRHADGYMTTYAHLERIYAQRDGVVGKGEMIGTVGISGGLTSPQLHFEVRKGAEALNPEKFLPFSG